MNCSWIYISFFLLLVIPNSLQVQTVGKSFYLQTNERYTLELDSLYSFPASNFVWSTDLPYEQVNVPYQQLGKPISLYHDLEILASFEVDSQTKYCLTFYRDPIINTSNQKIIIEYYRWVVDPLTGNPKREIRTRATFMEEVAYHFEIYASFYNEFCGFITVKDSKGRVSLKHFEYLPDSSSSKDLIIKDVRDGFISKHVSRQSIVSDTEKTVFIILSGFGKQNLVLAKYNYNDNDLTSFVHYDIGSDYSLVSSANIIAIYKDHSSSLTTVEIDYSTEKLLFKNQDIPQLNQDFKPISLQQMNQVAILTVLDEVSKTTAFVKFQLARNYNQGSLTLLNVQPFPSLLNEKLKFIDENHLVFAQNNTVSLINTNLKRITYQIQLDPENSTSLQEHIGSIFFSYQSVESQYYATPFLIQNPSITIISSLYSTTYNIKVVTKDINFGVDLNVYIYSLSTDRPFPNTGRAVSLTNTISKLDSTTYTFPIDSYYEGTSLRQSVTSDRYIDNVEVGIFGQETFLQSIISKQNIANIHQTDGEFSSIIIRQLSDTEFSIAAVSINDKFKLYESSEIFNSTIQQMDNYGSFIIASTIQQPNVTINIPVAIKEGKLQLFKYQVSQCNSEMSFATDLLNNVLFVLCESKITFIKYYIPYQNKDGSSILQIVSSEVLNFDYSGFSSLVCIKGRLFVYSDTQIASFNYLENKIEKAVIQIPILTKDKSQKIVLFSDSFLVAVIEDPIKTISQYSYENFVSQTPIYLRKIYIEPTYRINENFITLAKRNKMEYLLIKTASGEEEYLMYRMNKQFNFQTQLHGIMNVYLNANTSTIFSSSAICNILIGKQVGCREIFEQNSISYQVNIRESDFYQNLVFYNTINFKVGQSELRFGLKLIRNSSASLGRIDQKSNGIQSLRTQLQDSYFTKNTTFKYDDWKAYSSCVHGWESSSESIRIQQKLEKKDLTVNDTAVIQSIMYRQKIEVGLGYISLVDSGKIILQDRNIDQNCYVYDDQGSKNMVFKNRFSIDVYILCNHKEDNMIILNMFYQSTKNEDNTEEYEYIDSEVRYRGEFDSPSQLLSIDRLISNNYKIWLFDTINSLSYKFIKNDYYSRFDLVQNKDILTPISINVINNNQIQLDFYSNGQINVKNMMDKGNVQYGVYNLFEIIQGYNELNDLIIESIQQLQDNLFRIQMRDDFIYEISFYVEYDNKLVAQRIDVFTFQDSIDKQIYSTTNGNQTAIIGKLNNNKIYVLFYNYEHNKYTQKLIESTLFLDGQVIKKITFAEFVSSDLLTIHFNQGVVYSIQVNQQVGIQFNNDRSYFEGNNVQIYPLDNPDQFIQFTLQQLPPKPNIDPEEPIVDPKTPTNDPLNTNSLLMSFHLVYLIGILFALIFVS